MLANSKLVSVQIGTRGRSKLLPPLVDNILSTSSGNSEVIFYVDDDDIETIQMVKTLPVRSVINRRGLGYWDYARWHNEMAEIAYGELLLQGNDDMEFVTQDWDQLLINKANKYPDSIYALKMWNNRNINTMPFPIVNKKLIEIMGCYCPEVIPWVDRFIHTVMAELNRLIDVHEVKVLHHRNNDAVWHEAMRACRPEWERDNRATYQKPLVDRWVNKLGAIING